MWPRIVDAVALAQPLPRDRPGRHAHRRLARRLAAAAAIVADAVLLPVRVVGMAGTKRVGDVRVVLAARVDVADEKRDRRPRRAALEHAGENFHGVRLAPLRDVARRPGTAAIELLLDVALRERQAGRTAVDHAADRRTVRLAERREREQGAEGVAGHEILRERRCVQSSVARSPREASVARAPRARIPPCRARCNSARLSSRALRGARFVAVLTGAGVSAESGVPTFRDAQTGPVGEIRSARARHTVGLRAQSETVWDWYAMRRAMVGSVAPNPAHVALAALERRVPEFLLITQNVDGLHQRAGSTRVVELHGNITRVKCSREGTPVATWDEPDDELPPRCAACGAYLRPDVVWFEELLPAAEFARRRGGRAPLRRVSRRRDVGRGLPGRRAA